MSVKLEQSDWIWRDGEFIAWDDAKIHILTLAVQFGASVFEGIRCYQTANGPAIFRLADHMRRMRRSCRVYRMELSHTDEELIEACKTVIDRNRLEECYLRTVVLRGYGAAGMNPEGSPIETYIACWPWGTYLGAKALEQGVDVCVSSWQRMAPNTYPSEAKAAGHYTNAQLIKMDALAMGFVEGIALGPGGLVSEGSGQNLFLVFDGVLITPSVDGTSLSGITQDSVLTLAQDLDIPVRRQSVPREMLYTADELFLVGTATEVTPVRSVDRITVGEGRCGPITRQLQQRFLAVVRGEAEDRHGWLTAVRKVVGSRL